MLHPMSQSNTLHERCNCTILNIAVCITATGALRIALVQFARMQSKGSPCLTYLQDLIDSAVFLEKDNTHIGTVIDVYDGTGKA